MSSQRKEHGDGLSSIEISFYKSPLGFIELTTSGNYIFSLKFVDAPVDLNKVPARPAMECIRQLDEYFTGKRKDFELNLEPAGSPFQKHVWDELLRIPFGKTISYKQLAKNLGDEKTIRAAASANGKNPICIIIPCHRVIGSNGELVGYSGGLHRKEWLLAFEKGEIQTELQF